VKIYTYYHNLAESDDLEQQLIELWRVSWSRQGYTPIVLSLTDAQQHPYFETLSTEMPRFFNQITNRTIAPYGMHCWYRWLAYATQPGDEKFYVSDYDVINVKFPVTEPSDKLHLMDNACPCFASGTSRQFANICNAFVDVSNERLDILKVRADHYHDQEFFKFNCRDDNAMKDRYNLLMTRDRTFLGPVDADICHLAHAAVDWYVTEVDEYRVKNYDTLRGPEKHNIVQTVRIRVAKDLLNID